MDTEDGDDESAHARVAAKDKRKGKRSNRNRVGVKAGTSPVMRIQQAEEEAANPRNRRRRRRTNRQKVTLKRIPKQKTTTPKC